MCSMYFLIYRFMKIHIMEYLNMRQFRWEHWEVISSEDLILIFSKAE